MMSKEESLGTCPKVKAKSQILWYPAVPSLSCAFQSLVFSDTPKRKKECVHLWTIRNARRLREIPGEQKEMMPGCVDTRVSKKHRSLDKKKLSLKGVLSVVLNDVARGRRSQKH